MSVALSYYLTECKSLASIIFEEKIEHVMRGEMRRYRDAGRNIINRCCSSTQMGWTEGIKPKIMQGLGFNAR